MVQRKCGWVGLALLGLSLGGCTDGSRSQQVGPYTVGISTEPDPLELGQDAEITVSLQGQQGVADDCNVRFRQHMPGMEMSTDDVWHDMTPIGEGRYRARGTEYTMGGDWALEVVFQCDDRERTAVFEYYIPWPE